MQLQIVAKMLVLCCHLVNTNEEFGGLAMAILPFAKLLSSLLSVDIVAVRTLVLTAIVTLTKLIC